MKTPRIAGVDLASAVALLGIFTTSFWLVLTGNFISLSGVAFDLIQDVFSALFIFLSGMIVTVMLRGSRRTRKLNSYLIKKGMLFLIIGFGVTIIWPVNFMFTLAIMFFLSPVLSQLHSSFLWFGILGLFLISTLAMTSSINFSPEYLHYDITDYKTFVSFFSYTLFSGYYSIFPWSIPFVGGLLFARREFLKRRRRRKNFLIAYTGIGLGIIVELLVRQVMSEVSVFGPDINSLYYYSFQVSMPAFILISTSLCILMVSWFNDISSKYKKSKLVKRLINMGTMKHSLYIAHLLAGIMLSWMFNEKFFHYRPVMGSLILGFYIFCLIFSIYWKRQYDNGPIEWLLHKLAGTDDDH